MVIGFIGVGLMGEGIAKNLLQAGHQLRIVAHNNRQPIERLIALGARELANETSLATEVEALFLCLPNADTVSSIMGRIRANLHTGCLVVDTTTSLPETSAGLAASLHSLGVDFIDAPVTGGPPGAASGTLTSMAGGDPIAFQRARPLIELYSERVVHLGESGAGNRAKLIHNFITMGHVALIVEAMRRCDKVGLDRIRMFEVLSNGGANSNTLHKMVPSALSGSYDGHKFSLENATKDVDYAARMSAQLGEQSPLIEGMVKFFHHEMEHYAGKIFLSELLKTDE